VNTFSATESISVKMLDFKRAYSINYYCSKTYRWEKTCNLKRIYLTLKILHFRKYLKQMVDKENPEGQKQF
jgi:hypothetical protein